jgi:hypothetical protein
MKDDKKWLKRYYSSEIHKFRWMEECQYTEGQLYWER